MAGIDDVLRNGATMAKQRDATFAAGVTLPDGGVKSMLMTLPIGTRVLDLITGEEGVVIDGRRDNVVISIASQPGS